MGEKAGSSTAPGVSVEMLREARASLSRIYHDVNNPLAIISGNAQFLKELGEAMELDDDLRQPIADINEATHRVGHSLQELVKLKERIGQYLDDVGIE